MVRTEMAAACRRGSGSPWRSLTPVGFLMEPVVAAGSVGALRTQRLSRWAPRSSPERRPLPRSTRVYDWGLERGGGVVVVQQEQRAGLVAAGAAC